MALLLAVHSEHSPSDEEWDVYMGHIPGLLSHSNAVSIVMTDGGAPSSRQRERLRKLLGSASRWTAVIADKTLVRGVVTAVRWFNPKVCAFAPWEVAEAFKFVGVSAAQTPSVCEALRSVDRHLTSGSRVLAESLRQLELAEQLGSESA